MFFLLELTVETPIMDRLVHTNTTIPECFVSNYSDGTYISRVFDLVTEYGVDKFMETFSVIGSNIRSGEEHRFGALSETINRVEEKEEN